MHLQHVGPHRPVGQVLLRVDRQHSGMDQQSAGGGQPPVRPPRPARPPVARPTADRGLDGGGSPGHWGQHTLRILGRLASAGAFKSI